MPGKSVEIEIIPSRMKAFVTVRPDAGSLPPGKSSWQEAIVAELQVHGVVFGIDYWAIDSLVEHKRWGEKVLVAKGIEPVPGEDGQVEFFFDPSKRPRPRQLENDKVDYREIGLIQIVNEHDLLARLIPAKPGVSGTTVTGEGAPARQGLEACILAGVNTYFSDSRKQELRAQVAGSVSLVHGIIQVERTLTVPGDVSFASGNLNYPGDIVVRGDVKSGFNVKASGQIEIRGIVEDAFIEAGGDILIKGGFGGSGRGMIRSGGTVHLKYIENQSVHAAGSVYVGETALHAQIVSYGSIFLTTGKGTVIGGHLKATGGITAKILGNPKHTQTIAEIFQQEIPAQELAQKERALSDQQIEISEIYKTLKILQSKKRLDKPQDEETESQLSKLFGRLHTLKEGLAVSLQERQAVEGRIEQTKSFGRVTVLRTAYPGTEIIIGDVSYTLHEICNRTVFKRSEDEIVMDEEVYV